MSLSPVQLQEIYQLIAADVALQQRLDNATNAQQAVDAIVASACLKNLTPEPADLLAHIQSLTSASSIGNVTNELGDEQLEMVAGGCDKSQKVGPRKNVWFINCPDFDATFAALR